MTRQQENLEKVRKFSQRLRTRAARRGIQQNELAELVGVTAPTVNGWFKASYRTKGATLRKLADVLGCSPEWLLGEEESEIEGIAAMNDALATSPPPPDSSRRIIGIFEELALWLLYKESAESINEKINKAVAEGRSGIARTLLDIKDALKKHPNSSVRPTQSAAVDSALRQVAGAAAEQLKQKA